MKRRMTIATVIAALAVVIPGCATDEPSAEPTGTTSTAAPETSSTPSADPAAAALRGDWQDVDAEWVVHFNDNGTFVEDFEGVVDFRVGTYAVDGDTVSLIGDDGNTDKGAIEGETLVFNLGTLTRLAP